MRVKILLCFLATLAAGCSPRETSPPAAGSEAAGTDKKIRVIFDTDANNELDDQHALAYLLLNGNTFDVEAVTVNATQSGGAVDAHYAEAQRVMQLCGIEGVPLLTGADGSFRAIRDAVGGDRFDGHEAVDFIVARANEMTGDRLMVLAVGKLTNVALALKKDPSIAGKMTVVWLGSNYPKPGEYNLENDTASVNFVLNTDVPFEMVTVRYGELSGTDAVRVTQEEVQARMPGLGPLVANAVTGRHGSSFHYFGDYSVNLFEHIAYDGDPPSRALYDMAAVAVVKNPSWARVVEIPCPVLIDGEWRERPGRLRTIRVWEDFDRDAIVEDFYATLKHPVKVTGSKSTAR